MEIVYSALLLHSVKLPITEENIKKIFQALGLSPDENKIKALIASLEGINIDEILKQAPSFVAPTSQQPEKKAEEKKEEEAEKKAEEAVAGLSALFG
ncbi:MAG: 50S ribosomal protein L12 [Candidatus Aenigmarchaeota archaeon]|nr:50S ribosomal protein L12 [Candidatus Aenigmarchaeota archaeon]